MKLTNGMTVRLKGDTPEALHGTFAVLAVKARSRGTRQFIHLDRNGTTYTFNPRSGKLTVKADGEMAYPVAMVTHVAHPPAEGSSHVAWKALPL